MKLAILTTATALAFAVPAFAAQPAAMSTGNVNLDLLTAPDQGCGNDGDIIFDGTVPPSVPDTYAGAMTGAWGKHDVILDIYTGQGLLTESGAGCQEAYAVLCTTGADPLNLELAADLDVCTTAKGDKSIVTGGMNLSTVNIEGLGGASGAMSGTIEPGPNGLDRLKAKIQAVVSE